MPQICKSLDSIQALLKHHYLMEVEKGSSEIQSLIFDKASFSKKEAIAWAKKKGFKTSKVDEKENTWRIRQHAPGKYKQMRTIRLKKGVQAVVGVKE